LKPTAKSVADALSAADFAATRLADRRHGAAVAPIADALVAGPLARPLLAPDLTVDGALAR
jgi:hypothetical protein